MGLNGITWISYSKTKDPFPFPPSLGFTGCPNSDPFFHETKEKTSRIEEMLNIYVLAVKEHWFFGEGSLVTPQKSIALVWGLPPYPPLALSSGVFRFLPCILSHVSTNIPQSTMVIALFVMTYLWKTGGFGYTPSFIPPCLRRFPFPFR